VAGSVSYTPLDARVIGSVQGGLQESISFAVRANAAKTLDAIEVLEGGGAHRGRDQPGCCVLYGPGCEADAIKQLLTETIQQIAQDDSTFKRAKIVFTESDERCGSPPSWTASRRRAFHFRLT
jgi:hypothetical protein